jgi:RNA polymerase sigma factor (TIGR02999 family)
MELTPKSLAENGEKRNGCVPKKLRACGHLANIISNCLDCRKKVWRFTRFDTPVGHRFLSRLGDSGGDVALGLLSLSVPPMNDVTRILSSIEQGDPHAASQLLPVVYDELRRLAAQRLSQEKPGQTLEATALVHEAYLRLVGTEEEKSWDNRGHFFAAAAEAMRRILVENARRKRSGKHGGDRVRQDIDEQQLAAPELGADLLALDEALNRLGEQDPLKAELVKLRHFAGLTVDQAAQALGISSATADRYWAYARAWLHAEISRDAPPPGGLS